MRTLLITGFDPFDGETINPAWEAVKRLPGRIADFRLRKVQIPTVFGKAPETVLEAAGEANPDIILCIGQAGGRDAVTPERIAVNIMDARIPDNEGNRPQDEFILDSAPAAYFTTVPVKEMAQAIREKGLPGKVSNTAGTFVCNETLYRLLHHYQGTKTKVGFIHVPYLPEQGTPSLPMDQTTTALQAAIEAL